MKALVNSTWWDEKSRSVLRPPDHRLHARASRRGRLELRGALLAGRHRRRPPHGHAGRPRHADRPVALRADRGAVAPPRSAVPLRGARRRLRPDHGPVACRPRAPGVSRGAVLGRGRDRHRADGRERGPGDAGARRGPARLLRQPVRDDAAAAHAEHRVGGVAAPAGSRQRRHGPARGRHGDRLHQQQRPGPRLARGAPGTVRRTRRQRRPRKGLAAGAAARPRRQLRARGRGAGRQRARRGAPADSALSGPPASARFPPARTGRCYNPGRSDRSLH